MKRLNVLLILILILASCAKQQTIDVVFVNDGVEPNIAFTPLDLIKFFKKRSSFNKIEVSQKQFDSIANGFTATAIAVADSCEPRFCVVIDGKKIFVDYWNTAFTETYDSVIVSPQTIYLLRKECGYYNTIPSEDLVLNTDIIKYGIPTNYTYKRTSFLGAHAACTGIILKRKRK